MPPPGAEEENRKRRVHKKSRRGCRNCKIRRVKCDESRPECTKCVQFGVSCNYDLKTLDLQPVYQGTTSLWEIAPGLKASPKLEIPRVLYPPFVVADQNSTFQLDTDCLERFHRFCAKTVLSIGAQRGGNIYQRAVLHLANEHPYLMHVIQTLTATHDRYSAGIPSLRRTTTEVFHWTQAASLFNKKLSGPIQPSDRDGLWATAAMLGVIAFSAIDAVNPGEAWPLRPTSPTDLEWIRMSEGKQAIWDLTEPSRADSLFSSIFYGDFEKDFGLDKPPKIGADGIPQEIATLCSLDEFSTASNNPYFGSAHTLKQLYLLKCNQSSMPKFLLFISHLAPEYRKLLEQKDHRSLVLLAIWYSYILESVWWVARRAVLEGQGICLYLEKNCKERADILDLIQEPMAKFRLADENFNSYRI